MRFIPQRKTVIYFLTILTLMFLILIIPSLLPIQSQAQKANNVAANDAQSRGATATNIFNNNIFIAGVSLIPYVGWGYIIFALWNTGTVIASYNQPWNWVLNNLFAWIELGVYSFMIMKSFKLLQLFRQRKTKFTDLDGKVVVRKTTGVWNEIVTTAMFSLIAACIVLLLSALLEYQVISRVILR